MTVQSQSKQGAEDVAREIREQRPNAATVVDKFMVYRDLAERRIAELEAENQALLAGLAKLGEGHA